MNVTFRKDTCKLEHLLTFVWTVYGGILTGIFQEYIVNSWAFKSVIRFGLEHLLACFRTPQGQNDMPFSMVQHLH